MSARDSSKHCASEINTVKVACIARDSLEAKKRELNPTNSIEGKKVHEKVEANSVEKSEIE